MTEIVVPNMEKLVIPEATRNGYRRPAYEIEYSPRLARDRNGKVISRITQMKAREIAKAAGCRLSTAAEEYELSKLGYEHPAFDDTFKRNPEKDHFWNWTETGLLRPSGKESEYTKEIKDYKAGNRPYFLRIVREGDKPVGELWIPRSGLVHEWSVFGIPTKTVEDRVSVNKNVHILPEGIGAITPTKIVGEHGDDSKTHFGFNAAPDEVSLLNAHEWGANHKKCFGLVTFSPHYKSVGYSFRLVRGPLPKYEKV